MPGGDHKNKNIPKVTSPTCGTLQNELNQLRTQVNDLRKEKNELKAANQSLVGRVEELESYMIASKNVNEKLRAHIDNIDQYGRRSNLIIKHVPVDDENETIKDLEGKMSNFLKNELNVPNASHEIDKVHRIGKPKEYRGAKQQNVIIRFRSHAARYTAYSNRKNAKKFKVAPNLTKHREEELFKAKSLVESMKGVKFVFADIHGDMKVLFESKMASENGTLKESHIFTSAADLERLLLRLKLIDDVNDSVVE